MSHCVKVQESGCVMDDYIQTEFLWVLYNLDWAKPMKIREQLSYS